MEKSNWVQATEGDTDTGVLAGELLDVLSGIERVLRDRRNAWTELEAGLYREAVRIRQRLEAAVPRPS